MWELIYAKLLYLIVFKLSSNALIENKEQNHYKKQFAFDRKPKLKWQQYVPEQEGLVNKAIKCIILL